MTAWRLFAWASRQWRTFAIAGFLVFVAVPLAAYLLGFKVGDAVVWASGIVLLAYTLETQAMRLEMARANKMAVQPLLVTIVETPERAAGAVIFVRNIGKGPALRVRFDDIGFLDGELSGTPSTGGAVLHSRLP